MIEDVRAVRDHGSIVQHERRQAAEWIDRLYIGEIPEHRDRSAIEGEAVVVQRHGGAADERRIVHPDQDHGAGTAIRARITKPATTRAARPPGVRRR
jgi:hypothetical protein